MLRYQTYPPEVAYDAFNELYNRYSQRVFSFLIKKLRNQGDSEDILQKVFIKIHESKHLYSPKYKFEQWLFVIARSAVLDHFRAESRYKKRLEGLVVHDLTLVETELESLPHLEQDQLELLEMKFIDELSYQEISKVVNKSEVSLRKTVSRLIGRLKKGEVV